MDEIPVNVKELAARALDTLNLPGATPIAIGNLLTMPSVGVIQSLSGVAGGLGGLKFLQTPTGIALAKKYPITPLTAGLIGSVLGQTVAKKLTKDEGDDK